MTAGKFRASGALCLILLDYVKPLDEVDAQLPAHVAWLEAGFAHGVLILAGRQDPRVGGIIIAQGTSAEIEALAATDPFVTSGGATARVIAFSPSFAAPGIAALLT